MVIDRDIRVLPGAFLSSLRGQPTVFRGHDMSIGSPTKHKNETMIACSKQGSSYIPSYQTR